MNNKEVIFQLVTVSVVTLINEQTWKKIGKPTLLKTEKIPRDITVHFVSECYANLACRGKT